MKTLALFLFLSGIGNSSLFGQENTLRVEIKALFLNEKTELEKWYKFENEKESENGREYREEDSVIFESLRFYLSGFELTRNGKSVWKESESYHLIDLENPASCEILLNIAKNTNFDRIRFYLGIDSLTNSGGVKGGDLDPVKGMYWTWQTGYIHFKLEGKSNLCPTRNNQFSLHIGGYSFSQNTLQTLEFSVSDPDKVTIELDLLRFLEEIDLRDQNHVMSPGAQAVKLSQQLALLFQNR